MSTEEVNAIIRNHPKWEQKIQLPFGLETPGRDLTGIADRVLPSDLKGASVLDFGCAEGFFCFEAKKRGAGKVVGVLTERDKLETAAGLSQILDIGVEFIEGNANLLSELGMFDYVLCLNYLYELKDPLHVLSELVKITRRELLMEIADISYTAKDQPFRKPSKSFLGGWGTFFRLLPYKLQPGILATDSRGRTLITRRWITNLFENQYFHVQKISFSDSDSPGCYLVSISMKRVQQLKVISGLSGVGKTVFLDKLLQGDKHAATLLDLNSFDGWKVMDANAIKTSNGVEELNRLILHLNITRPPGWEFLQNRNEPARIVERAEEKEVYILITSSQELVKRVEDRDVGNAKSSRIEKGKWLITQYQQPERVAGLYSDWILYCRSHNCKIKYIDVSSELAREVPEKEALRIIGSGARL